MRDDPCLVQQTGRRRIFWTTQPQACGEYTMCGISCVIPGLEYVESDTPSINVPPGVPRTIRNDEWLRSLILNILNTRARSDLKCPSPAAVYGHWSESYRKDNLYIGSRLWNAADKSYTSNKQIKQALEAAVTADMNKLIALKVADSVEVEADYRGRNIFGIVITATVNKQQHVLDLSGQYAQSGVWVWQ